MSTAVERSAEMLKREGHTVQPLAGPGPLASVANLLSVDDAAWGSLLVLAVPQRSAGVRLPRALEMPALRTWLSAGCRFEAHVWTSTPGPGGRLAWTVRRTSYHLADLVPTQIAAAEPVTTAGVAVVGVAEIDAD
jgi:hypothetical protein